MSDDLYWKPFEATRADNGGWVVKGEWFATEREALKRLALAAYGKPWPTRLEVLNSCGRWYARVGWGLDRTDEVGPFESPFEAAEAMADKLEA